MKGIHLHMKAVSPALPSQRLLLVLGSIKKYTAFQGWVVESVSTLI